MIVFVSHPPPPLPKGGMGRGGREREGMDRGGEGGREGGREGGKEGRRDSAPPMLLTLVGPRSLGSCLFPRLAWTRTVEEAP